MAARAKAAADTTARGMLPRLYGHADARGSLTRLCATEELPQSLLVYGAAGIGKERFALWLAQALLCDAPPRPGEPCDDCRACRAVRRLEHADVHWFFPLPRPDGAGGPEKLRQRLEEARAAELQRRRADPLHQPSHDSPAAYYLAAVQTLQHHAGLRPAAGRRKVFVVGDAELMVPQESSPEAANAFLKLLEEPPEETTFILTSATPGALLPTIRSRLLPVRLRPLAVDEVRDFLERERGLPPDVASRLAAQADGAIGRALRSAAELERPGELHRHREAGKALLSAIVADAETPRYAAALATSGTGGRGEFQQTLAALARWLRDLLATATGAPTPAADAADARFLSQIVQRRQIAPGALARGILRIEEAKQLAAGNVNPQLLAASLLREIRRDLRTG